MPIIYYNWSLSYFLSFQWDEFILYLEILKDKDDSVYCHNLRWLYNCLTWCLKIGRNAECASVSNDNCKVSLLCATLQSLRFLINKNNIHCFRVSLFGHIFLLNQTTHAYCKNIYTLHSFANWIVKNSLLFSNLNSSTQELKLVTPCTWRIHVELLLHMQK